MRAGALSILLVLGTCGACSCLLRTGSTRSGKDRSRILLAVGGRILEYAVMANGLSDHPVREHDLAGVGPISDLVLLPGGLFAVVAPERDAVFVLGR